MRSLILGTAGHIDHGKTALVRALTGMDTDRLIEEKRRGITIDLGFARLRLGEELELGIVDVPGHESFVRNMLAGATGIDLVLLVVAADEGVMPQTREHLDIVDLLGVRAGVVALSKVDLVDEDWLELVVEDLRAQLEATAFARSPIVPVSAETGAGLVALLAALEEAAGVVTGRGHEDLFRLPVDRVFTMRGTGTVVTGTVWSGSIGRDDTVRVLPLDRSARVRAVQLHGEETDNTGAGCRAALALAGIDRADLARGDVLVSNSAWRASHMLTVHLRLTEGTEWELQHRQRVRFHLGTAEVMARVALMDAQKLQAGQAGWAQLRLESPVVARAGDRFVIRSYSPVTTIGGGRVAEPAPPKRKRLGESERELLAAILDGNAAAAVAARVLLRGWRGQATSELPVETPYPRGSVEQALPALEGDTLISIGDLVFDRRVAEAAIDHMIAAADAFHAANPLRPGMDHDELRRSLPARAPAALGEWALAKLVADGHLTAMGGLVTRAGFAPTFTDDQRSARDAILAAYRQAGITPPALAELPAHLRERPDLRAILKLLEHQGGLVQLGSDLYAARSALDEATATVRRHLVGRSDLSPADFKGVLPVSRKFLIPLLEYFDRSGITARRGDERSVRA